jgi:hypothetical protein
LASLVLAFIDKFGRHLQCVHVRCNGDKHAVSFGANYILLRRTHVSIYWLYSVVVSTLVFETDILSCRSQDTGNLGSNPSTTSPFACWRYVVVFWHACVLTWCFGREMVVLGGIRDVLDGKQVETRNRRHFNRTPGVSFETPLPRHIERSY